MRGTSMNRMLGWVVAVWGAVSVAQEAAAPALSHPEGVEKIQMGVVQGGWGYVYACYGLAIGGAVLYALSLYVRRPRATPEDTP